MGSIKNFIEKIKSARYGKDVRQSIVDAIDEINKDCTERLNEQDNKLTDQDTIIENNVAKQDLLEKKYDEQIKNIASLEPQNAEIVDARSGFPTLGSIIKQKIYYFNNIEEMKNCLTLIPGDVVETLGFYEINDGGGANYTIRLRNKEDIEDNGSIHFVGDKLVAELIVKDTINVQIFGITGGKIDETNKIQRLFKYAKKKRIKIIFEKNKTYILRGGLELGEFSLVEGNNSTIKIDSIEDFKSGGNYTDQLLMDNGYDGNISLFDWRNINMEIAPQLILKDNSTETKPYSIFAFGNCNLFKMKNCKISIEGHKKNQITMFKFRGSGKIFIDDCNFYVKHRGVYGSVLWIQSTQNDKIYYARIKNTYIYDTCRDEIISIYSPNGHDVVFENCTIKKEFYDSYYTKDSTNDILEDVQHFMFTDIHSYKTTTSIDNDNHKTLFYNCEIICKPIKSNINTNPNMWLIAGHNDNQTKDFFKFDSCNFEVDGVKSIGYGGYNKTVNDLIQYYEYEILEFSNCNMKINTTSKYGLLDPAFWNVFFKNCIIESNNYVYDAYWQNTSIGSVPNLVYIEDCIIILKNMNKTKNIIHTVENSHQNYAIKNTDFICFNENNEYVEPIFYKKYTNSNGFSEDNVFLYNNSSYAFWAKNNRLNNVLISDVLTND